MSFPIDRRIGTISVGKLLNFSHPYSIQHDELFLDDIRTVEMVYPNAKSDEFVVVRTYEAFIKYIKKHGLPDFISFDNDLGLLASGALAPDGYAAAKWLVYDSGLDLSSLSFRVHSANPVAAEQIRGLLNNYLRFLNSKS